jgi:hypothetical protein
VTLLTLIEYFIVAHQKDMCAPWTSPPQPPTAALAQLYRRMHAHTHAHFDFTTFITLLPFMWTITYFMFPFSFTLLHYMCTLFSSARRERCKFLSPFLSPVVMPEREKEEKERRERGVERERESDRETELASEMDTHTHTYTHIHIHTHTHTLSLSSREMQSEPVGSTDRDRGT